MLSIVHVYMLLKLVFVFNYLLSQVPVLFSKAIEIFIMELTMRAWLHTEDNKRRTVQVMLNFLLLKVIVS